MSKKEEKCNPTSHFYLVVVSKIIGSFNERVQKKYSNKICLLKAPSINILLVGVTLMVLNMDNKTSVGLV